MSATQPEAAVPQGKPNRRFFAGSAASVVAVILVTLAVLIAIWLVRETVTWLVAAGFLAFSIEPLVRIFQRRGMGRGMATALAFLAIGGVVLFFAIALVPSIIDAAQGLKAAIPEWQQKLKDTGAAEALNADQAIDTAAGAASDTANFFVGSGKVLDSVGALVSGGFAVFMIFTFTLYFLVYGRDLKNRVVDRLPPHARAPFRSAASEIYTMNMGYWYGKFLIGLIAGMTCYVSMRLLGLPYAAALSLFVGITDLIPNIGATLGTIPVVIVGLLSDDPWKGVVIGVILIVYQQVENNLITPKVFKRTVEIHPFLSVVTVIAFTALFGIVGALVAVPVTKGIQISVDAYRESRRRAAGAAEPAASG